MRQNRMQSVKQQGEIDTGDLTPMEPEQGDPAPEAVKPDQCPKCRRQMTLVTERVVDNRVIRQYRCCDQLHTRKD